VAGQLLAKGASVVVTAGPQGLAALHFAAESGHRDVVRVLLAAGASVDVAAVQSIWTRGWTALHFAAALGHAGVVEELLAARADVLLETSSGHTALSGAAVQDHAIIMTQLLPHHNAATVDGREALLNAAGAPARVGHLQASLRIASHVAAAEGTAAAVSLMRGVVQRCSAPFAACV
jgi:ankyrin repeat protein